MRKNDTFISRMKNYLKFIVLALIFSSIINASSAVAAEQHRAFNIGEWRELDSKILGETRQIIVGKPDSYATTKTSYPVIVLLDGDTHFHHTTGTMKFLAVNDFMPEAIVVAIPNTDRNRDLTPSSQSPSDKIAVPSHGGANNFLGFIGDELVPWLNNEYRTSDYRILIGHSYGGLFAIHTLTTRPDIFNAYIAISPSLQWNDQHLVEQMDIFLEKHSDINASLYMTAGNEGGALVGGVQKVSGVLTQKAPHGLLWDVNVMDQETHGSVPHKSTYLGMEAIFSGWRLQDPLLTFEQGGVEAIISFYEHSSEKYGIHREVPGQVLGNLAFGLMEHGRLDESGEVLLYGDEVFSPPATFLNELANAYLAQDNKKAAIKFFSKALEANPANKESRARLAELNIDPNSLIKTVTVDEKTLAKYAGVFSIPPSITVNVALENGKLVRVLEGSPTVDLLPLSETKFYRANDDIQYVFNVEDNGEVNNLTVIQFGQRINAQRIK